MTTVYVPYAKKSRTEVLLALALALCVEAMCIKSKPALHLCTTDRTGT